MWLVEAINTLDNNHLDGDGIYARSVSHLWGILTSPFIHASFQHLLDNTVPFVFLGVIIALHGARRLALVTGFIIVIGGLGTWLISPSAHNADTIGASGVVFGYASYLLTRGFFDRSIWELGVGIIVGVIWGAVLISSLVPHTGISWQAPSLRRYRGRDRGVAAVADRPPAPRAIGRARRCSAGRLSLLTSAGRLARCPARSLAR